MYTNKQYIRVGLRYERVGEPAVDTWTRAGGRVPKAEGRVPRVESRGPSAESRGPSAEGREPRAECRKPRADGRGPRAEGRGSGGGECGLEHAAVTISVTISVTIRVWAGACNCNYKFNYISVTIGVTIRVWAGAGSCAAPRHFSLASARHATPGRRSKPCSVTISVTWLMVTTYSNQAGGVSHAV